MHRINNHRSRIITILALAAITTFMIGSPVSAQDNEKAVRDVLIQSAVGFETGDMAALENSGRTMNRALALERARRAPASSPTPAKP